jgi:enamine deaminase RidA (YjgF/YER057c/UK114 family)
MKIFDMPQLSPEWFEARRGIPTASSFDKILTPKKGEPSSSQEDYLCELAAERLALVPPADRPMSGAMRHGVDYEAEARRWFEFEADCEVRQVGFVTTDDGRLGCSPDGLILGPDGNPAAGLELKCPQGKTHVKYLLDGVLPNDYRCQVHGALIVTGLPLWHFVSYAPGLAPLHIEVQPDKFTDKLRAALEDFNARLQAALAKLSPEPAEAA